MAFGQLKPSSPTKLDGKTVNRWAIYKELCIAKSVFGINDRCLAVISSLLSFLPENEITVKNGLVVFPSNRQLSLRAHGMPESTVRRHIATLIESGLIARRDSPNGKRYAYKNEAGQVEEAFGFSLAPLLYRAEEISQAAKRIQADAALLKRKREQITLQRRDLTQMINAALADSPSSFWQNVHLRFRVIVDAIPRRASTAELQDILDKLTALRAEIDKALIQMNNIEEMSTNHNQNERHHIESLPESHFESQNIKMNDLKASSSSFTETTIKTSKPDPTKQISLDTVLRACPDIKDYKPTGITSWRDLIEATRTVSAFLGITRSAYHEACQVMGVEGLSATIAGILQRIREIGSAGGYLRSLTHKARVGEFSIAQMLLSLMKANRSQHALS
ncbi:Plasmid replication protein RepC [Ochrobactrum soli]|uniref:Plasmid replication protein RepC n=2 Tax=Brucellaceae TaxID=118882 RepID=A0A2P9HB02_9HYPH|nr:Plasmid replication protein RepC [[Ochrobactrum] soli]